MMGEIKDKKYIGSYTSFLYSLFMFALLMARSIFKFRAGGINKTLKGTVT